MDLVEHVARIEYPGRGCAVGTAPDGTGIALYWVTGRSEASRRRRVRAEADRVVIEDAREAAPNDPLRHYTALVRLSAHRLVVGNGTHVDDLAATTSTEAFLASFAAHEFEPDPPIRTPRIGAVCFADPRTEAVDVAAGAARACPVDPERTEHVVSRATGVPPGAVLAVTTYGGAAEPIETDGTPRWFSLSAGAADVVAPLWEALRPELRVAVLAVPLGAELTAATIRQTLG